MEMWTDSGNDSIGELDCSGDLSKQGQRKKVTIAGSLKEKLILMHKRPFAICFQRTYVSWGHILQKAGPLHMGEFHLFEGKLSILKKKCFHAKFGLKNSIQRKVTLFSWQMKKGMGGEEEEETERERELRRQ